MLLRQKRVSTRGAHVQDVPGEPQRRVRGPPACHNGPSGSKNASKAGGALPLFPEQRWWFHGRGRARRRRPRDSWGRLSRQALLWVPQRAGRPLRMRCRTSRTIGSPPDESQDRLCKRSGWQCLPPTSEGAGGFVPRGRRGWPRGSGREPRAARAGKVVDTSWRGG